MKSSQAKVEAIKLHKNKKSNRHGEVTSDGVSDDLSDEIYSLESKEVEKWTLAEVGEWLEHLQLGEYKYYFQRHDIQGAELICLQRRDSKELRITKVGHIKRIVHGIGNLHDDAASVEVFT